MDRNFKSNVENRSFSSNELIKRILSVIGLSRERTSTYSDYRFDNGTILRLRISDHGLFLQYWYDKNREARMNRGDVPKLNVGQNLAITFSLTKQECEERNTTYPQKIANKTSVKTEQGNNVKPQFSVRHICYITDKLTENDVQQIINAMKATVSYGIYNEPLQDNTKVVEWIDTSNCTPQKVQGERLNRVTNQTQQQTVNYQVQQPNQQANNSQQIQNPNQQSQQQTNSNQSSNQQQANNQYPNQQNSNNQQNESFDPFIASCHKWFQKLGYTIYEEKTVISNQKKYIKEDKTPLEECYEWFERLGMKI